MAVFDPAPTASVARAALRRVEAERRAALQAGIGGRCAERLDRAVAGATQRYVMSAVLEIASLRGELGARPRG